MKLNEIYYNKSPVYSKLIIYGFIALALILPFILCFDLYKEPQEPSKPSPPDLKSCTRVELRYLPSTLDFFFHGAEARSILSSQEIGHLNCLTEFVIDDQELLRAFAHHISSGSYIETSHLMPRIFNTVRFIYCKGDRLAFFTMIGGRVVTEESHWFDYDDDWAILDKLTPQIVPFKLRLGCSWSLRDLGFHFHIMREYQNVYPVPSEWCDKILSILRNDGGYSEEDIIRCFTCPSIREDIANYITNPCREPNEPNSPTENQHSLISHYAMNPNCEPNSQPDMVRLFETKAGWNQHGGPELFTFDNHDPKGGCVLLNDGTVKFIRTEEELQQLRWK